MEAVFYRGSLPLRPSSFEVIFHLYALFNIMMVVWGCCGGGGDNKGRGRACTSLIQYIR